MHISTRIAATSARVCSWLVPEHTRHSAQQSTPLPEPRARSALDVVFCAVVRCFFSKAAAARFGVRTNSRDNLPFPAGVRATQLYFSDVHSWSGTLNMYLVLCLLRRWWARFFFWVMFIVFSSCSLRAWLGKNLFIADLCLLHTGRVIFGNSTGLFSLPVAGLSLPPGHHSFALYSLVFLSCSGKCSSCQIAPRRKIIFRTATCNRTPCPPVRRFVCGIL